MHTQHQSRPVVADQDVEGVKLDLVMLARVQYVKIGDAVNTEQHGLAVDGERVVQVAHGCLDDERIPAALVVAIAGVRGRTLRIGGFFRAKTDPVVASLRFFRMI